MGKLNEAKQNTKLLLTLYQSAPVSQNVISRLDKLCRPDDIRPSVIDLSIIDLISSGDPVRHLRDGNWASIKSEYVQATMSTLPGCGHKKLAFESSDDHSTPTEKCHITNFTCSPKGYKLAEETMSLQPSYGLTQISKGIATAVL